MLFLPPREDRIQPVSCLLTQKTHSYTAEAGLQRPSPRLLILPVPITRSKLFAKTTRGSFSSRNHSTSTMRPATIVAAVLPALAAAQHGPSARNLNAVDLERRSLCPNIGG